MGILKTQTNNEKTHLNDGMGDPCAGHNNGELDPSILLKVKLSASCENLGLAPPIGSEFKIKNHSSQTHLYAGMGDP